MRADVGSGNNDDDDDVLSNPFVVAALFDYHGRQTRIMQTRLPDFWLIFTHKYMQLITPRTAERNRLQVYEHHIKYVGEVVVFALVHHEGRDADVKVLLTLVEQRQTNPRNGFAFVPVCECECKCECVCVRSFVSVDG